MTDLEQRCARRIGIFVINTANGATAGYREEEKFLMCSTSKVGVVAAVLDRASSTAGLLDHQVRYEQADLVAHSPVTTQHLDTGMTVAELCAAALTVSDNTAENLLLEMVGGPSQVTTFIHGMGDHTTQFDRREPALNDATDNGLDTTTPRVFCMDLQALGVGGRLVQSARDQLTDWMKQSSTGPQKIRAGVPSGWAVADKTGAGSRGESNDVAIVWPPSRPPLVITVFTALNQPNAGENDSANAAIAGATQLGLRAVGAI